MVWEIVFMLLILKIPLVWVCVVVWWAIKSEPTPPDVELEVVADTPPAGGSPRRQRDGRRRPLRPHAPGSAAARRHPGARPAAERRSHMTSVDAPSDRHHSPADVVAGFLAVASIVLSLFAMGLGLILEVDARPARSAFVAIILALVSARLSARWQSLALKAVLFAMLAWVVGMTLAVLTENPLI